MAVFQPNRDQTKVHRIDRFRGLNVSVDATQIASNESPDLLNVYVDSTGALVQRTGYRRIFTDSLGSGKVLGIHDYRKTDGTLIRLLHHGTKLYTWDESGDQPLEIFAGMNGSRYSEAFTMGNKCYLLDGNSYLVYDGTTVTPVVGYVPTLRIFSPPTGGGEAFEGRNLLTGLFRQGFNGDGVAVNYQLSLVGLAPTAVKASLNGGTTYDKVEGTHFTVNRATGLITFLTAPPTGVGNVMIEADQVIAGDPIRTASGHLIYGGTNDSRVFVWNKHILYSSDVYNPTYFPIVGLQAVGTESEHITGGIIQYDSAVIYKTHSIWSISYFDDGTRITFPMKSINNSVGCIAPNSLQIINNNGTALTTTGVFELVGGVVRDERNVSQQSRRVDRLLQQEGGIQDAVSVDFDNRYYLAINGRVYLWDYGLAQQDPTQKGEWFLWNNIPASCFYNYERDLFFGDSASGMIYKFADPDEADGYNDDGAVIETRWKSKLEDFGASELYKTVKKLYYAMKPYSRSAVRVFFIDEDGMSQELGRDGLSLFSYETWSYSNFSYVMSQNPREFVYKIKAKKIVHLQIEFRNGEVNERFGVLSAALSFEVKGYVK